MQTMNQKYSDILMLSKNHSPRLYIVNYFDLIINQIDLTAEVTLDHLNDKTTSNNTSSCSGSSRTATVASNEDEHDEINRIRGELIHEIKRLEQAALVNYDKNLKTNAAIFNNLSANGEKSDTADMRNKLFSNYCILIDKNSLSNKYNYKLGLLVVLDWYLSEMDHKILNKALYKAQIVKMGENVGIDFQFFENTRDEPSTSILNNSLISAEYLKERIKENESTNSIIKITMEEVKALKRLDLTSHQISRIEPNILSQYKHLKQLLIKIDNLNELIGNFSFVNLNNINLEELYLRYYSDSETVDLNLISGLKNLKNLKILNEYQGSSNKVSSVKVESIFVSDQEWDKAYSQNLTKLESLFINDKLIESLKTNFQLINNLTSLKKLNLLNTDRFYSFIDNNNNITYLVNNTDFLRGLTNLEELTLQYTKIKSIRRINFLLNFCQLKKLSLCLNEIEHIDSSAFFNLSYLEELDLNFNTMRILDDDLFENMKRLRVLKLFNNKIEVIKESAFSDLPMLVKLDLGINALDFSKNLNSSIFDKLANLRILCLSQNCIKSLDEKLFDNLILLEELDLSFNEIKSLKTSQFSKLSNLKCLNLNKNKVQSIDADCFHELTQLEELNVNSNLLQTISGGYFKSLCKLKVLDLSENAIHNIDNQTFQGLVSLIKLDLSSNMLNEIRTEFSSSGDLRLLIILNLSMNKIEHVDENAFASLSSLGKLILYGNHVQIEKSSKFYDKLINLEELDDDDDEEYLHYESVNQFRDN